MYESCFSAAAREPSGEAGLVHFEKEPERQWEKLDGMFGGPQEFDIHRITRDEAFTEVKAPEADGGGVGSVYFVKENCDWLIERW